MLGFEEPPKFNPPSLRHSLVSSPLSVVLRLLYRNILRLHIEPANPDPISIVAISDTHDFTPDLPFGVVLIHAGDLTKDGTPADIQAQIDWLDALPHTHKVVIAGNHDYYLDSRAYANLPDPKSHARLDWKSIKYLQHDSTTLSLPHTERTLTIYGAPQIPACGPGFFAFQYPADELHDAWSDTVPMNTDLLVTHTPPKYHLDLAPRHLGCHYLLKETWRIKPRMHIYGHVHAGVGTELVNWDNTKHVYERALARADSHKGPLTEVLDLKLWVELARLLVYGFLGLVWRYVWAGSPPTCRMVNAGLVDHTTKLVHKPQVFDI